IRDFHVTGVQTCALPIFCFQVSPPRSETSGRTRLYRQWKVRGPSGSERQVGRISRRPHVLCEPVSIPRIPVFLPPETVARGDLDRHLANGTRPAAYHSVCPPCDNHGKPPRLG